MIGIQVQVMPLRQVLRRLLFYTILVRTIVQVAVAMWRMFVRFVVQLMSTTQLSTPTIRLMLLLRLILPAFQGVTLVFLTTFAAQAAVAVVQLRVLVPIVVLNLRTTRLSTTHLEALLRLP